MVFDDKSDIRQCADIEASSSKFAIYTATGQARKDVKFVVWLRNLCPPGKKPMLFRAMSVIDRQKL